MNPGNREKWPTRAGFSHEVRLENRKVYLEPTSKIHIFVDDVYTMMMCVASRIEKFVLRKRRNLLAWSREKRKPSSLM